MKGHFQQLVAKLLLNYTLVTGDENDRAKWGGKVVGLSALMRCGFRIPQSLAMASDQFQVPVSPGYEGVFSASCLSEIRAWIDAADLTLATGHDMIETLLETSGVIIRSSSSSEDSNTYSMAGVFESFAGAHDLESLVSRIKDCWKSLYSQSSASILQKGRFASHPPFALVLQEQVPCEVAGVCFSVDPLDPASETVVVEANWGNCSSVVAGHVEPDRYRLKGGLVEVRIGRKESYDVFTKTGVATLKTPADLRRAPCLRDNHLQALAEAAITMVAAIGQPSELEFGIHDGGLVFFQCRSVTTS